MSLLCGNNCCTDFRSGTNWPCDGPCGRSFHIKCAGLTPGFAEKIKKNEGTMWFCDECRKIILKSCSKSLIKINEDIGKVFRDISSIHDRLSEVVKPLLSLRDDTSPQSSEDVSLLAEGSLLGFSDALSSNSAVIRPPGSARCTAPSLDRHVVDTLPAPLMVSENVTSKNNLDLPLDQDENLLLNSPIVGCNSSVGDTGSTSVRIVDEPSQPVVSSLEAIPTRNPLELAVVPPRKVIFISRLLPSIEVCDIVHHITNKLNIDVGSRRIVTTKIASGNYSSFKIFAEEHDSRILLDPRNWPEGTIVKEFESRSRSRRGASNSNGSKNSKTSRSFTKM